MQRTTLNHGRASCLDRACISETIMSTHEARSEQRPEDHIIEILTLGVLPAYQRRGLGRHLIDRVSHHFRNSCDPAHHVGAGTLICANVATSNVSALSFYRRMGMRISSDVIRNMYRTRSHNCRDAYLVVGSLTTSM